MFLYSRLVKNRAGMFEAINKHVSLPNNKWFNLDGAVTNTSGQQRRHDQIYDPQHPYIHS